MKMPLLILLAAGSLSAAPVRIDDRDEDRLQGRWVVVAVQGLPLESFKGMTLVFATNGASILYPGNRLDGSFRLGPAREPKEIDITYTDASRGEWVMRGLYQLEGDTLKLCIGSDNGPRPVKFGEPYVFTYQREK